MNAVALFLLCAGLDVVRKDSPVGFVEVAPTGWSGARLDVLDAHGDSDEQDVDESDHSSGTCIDPQSRDFKMPRDTSRRPDPTTEAIVSGLHGVAAGLTRAFEHGIANLVAGPLGNVAVTSVHAGMNNAKFRDITLKLEQRRESMRAFYHMVKDVRKLVTNDRLHDEAEVLLRRAADVGSSVEEILQTATKHERALIELAGVHHNLQLSRSEYMLRTSETGAPDAQEKAFMLLLPAAKMAEAHVALLICLELLAAAMDDMPALERWAGVRVKTAAKYGQDLVAMRKAATDWRASQYEMKSSVEWEQCNGMPLDPAVFEPEPPQHWTTTLFEWVVGVHDERLASHLCAARRCWLEDSYLCPENPRDVVGNVRPREKYFMTLLREEMLTAPNVHVAGCNSDEDAKAALDARRAKITGDLEAELQKSLDSTVSGVLLPAVRAACEPLLAPLDRDVHLDTDEATILGCFDRASPTEDYLETSN